MMFCLLGDMLDEVTAIVEGYNAYFSFSKVKTGYSGEFKCANKHRSNIRYCNQGSISLQKEHGLTVLEEKNIEMFFGTAINSE